MQMRFIAVFFLAQKQKDAEVRKHSICEKPARLKFDDFGIPECAIVVGTSEASSTTVF